MSNDFSDELKKRELELEVIVTEKKRAKIEAERELIEAEAVLSEIKNIRLKYEVKKPNNTRLKQSETIMKNSFNFSKMTITDSIYQVLSAEKTPLPLSKIAERVKEGGYPTRASDFKKVINTAISRDQRFSNTQPGKAIWGLAERR